MIQVHRLSGGPPPVNRAGLRRFGPATQRGEQRRDALSGVVDMRLHRSRRRVAVPVGDGIQDRRVLGARSARARDGSRAERSSRRSARSRVSSIAVRKKRFPAAAARARWNSVSRCMNSASASAAAAAAFARRSARSCSRERPTAARRTAAGSTASRYASASSTSAARRRRRARSDFMPMRLSSGPTTKLPPPYRPRRLSTMPSSTSSRIACWTVARPTPKIAARSRSGGRA